MSLAGKTTARFLLAGACDSYVSCVHCVACVALGGNPAWDQYNTMLLCVRIIYLTLRHATLLLFFIII